MMMIDGDEFENRIKNSYVTVKTANSYLLHPQYKLILYS